jgi:hypothetical protein
VTKAGAFCFALALLSCAVPPPPPPHEITEPTPLLDADGHLLAQGWARQPYPEYQRDRVMPGDADRLREWEYVQIFAPTFAVSVTIADLGVVAIATMSVQDYTTGETTSDSLIGNPSTLTLPETPFGSTTWGTSTGQASLAYDAGTRTITYCGGTAGTCERASAMLGVVDDPSGESLTAVTRFSPDGLFFYENKRVGLAATGTLRMGTTEYTLPDGASWAVIDWGRGAWPENVTWEWAAASGSVDGRRVGINLGSVHGDDSLGTPDGVVVDGVLHKMSRVRWTFDATAPLSPWHFTSDDGRLDLTMTPDYDESGMLDLGRNSMHTSKAHGVFRGTVVLDDGTTLAIDGVRGAAEHVEITW